MKQTRQFAAVAGAVLVSSTLAIAQAPAPQSGAAAKAPDQKVVAVGCLRATETTPVATTISVVAYTLTNASIVNQSSTGSPASGAATATVGAAASAGAASSDKGMTYALAAENLEELRTHENQRVEIIGRMSPALTASPTAAVGTAGSKPGAADPPRIRVDAVKMVAGSCDVK